MMMHSTAEPNLHGDVFAKPKGYRAGHRRVTGSAGKPVKPKIGLVVGLLLLAVAIGTLCSGALAAVALIARAFIY